jgi:hypothetical protein
MSTPYTYRLADGRVIVGFNKLTPAQQQAYGYTPEAVELIPSEPVELTIEQQREQRLQELDSAVNSFVDARYNATLKMNIMSHAMMAMAQGKELPKACLDFHTWKTSVEQWFVSKQTEIQASDNPAAVDIDMAAFDVTDPAISTRDLI